MFTAYGNENSAINDAQAIKNHILYYCSSRGSNSSHSNSAPMVVKPCGTLECSVSNMMKCAFHPSTFV